MNYKETESIREIVMYGVGVSSGIALGEALLTGDMMPAISKKINSTNQEINKLDLAISLAKKELKQALKARNQEAILHYLLEAYLMVLEDHVLINKIRHKILSEKVSAMFSLDSVINGYKKTIAESKDISLKERAGDMEEIKHRLFAHLDKSIKKITVPKQAILIAKTVLDLPISLIIHKDLNGVFIEQGGVSSHVAIMCRAMGIPMVCGKKVSKKIKKGMKVLIDGLNGKIFVHPTKLTLNTYKSVSKRTVKAAFSKKCDNNIKSKGSINVGLNISFKEEINQFAPESLKADILLYRSEMFLTLMSVYPSIRQQQSYYSEIARRVYPKRFVVRLFDIGRDKRSFINSEAINLSRGYRGIRVLIDNPEILKDQLTAIILTSMKYNNVEISIPVVVDSDQVKTVRKTLKKIKYTLAIKSRKKIRIGAMIETPACVEVIDDILDNVDFISVGMNDLLQYSLAVDRNEVISEKYYNPLHPAFLRILNRICLASKRKKTECNFCGDVDQNPMLLFFLLGIGFRRFSVTSGAMNKIKKMMLEFSLTDAKVTARQCLALNNYKEIRKLLSQKIARMQ